MHERFPNLIYSDLGGNFSQEGISVELSIMKLEGCSEWTLEVVNGAGKSVLWEQGFADAKDAYIEFLQTVAVQGIHFFLNESNVIQFPGR